MWNRKPEFIDPEEQKFIYYYNRNSKRKTLDEKECCPKRRGILVFESTKGRIGVVVVYLILIGYIYLSSSRYGKTNIARYNDIKIKMNNYYLESEKKVFLNLFLESKKKSSMHIDSVYIKIQKDKFNVEKEILVNEEIKIDPSYLLSYEVSFKEKPSEIFITLYIREEDKAIPINMKNKF